MLSICLVKSFVTSVCVSISSKALSTRSLIWFICWFICRIDSNDCSTFSLPSASLEVVSFMESASSPISVRSSATYLTMSSADSAVLPDNCLTWSATTAKPFPASPALAASIDAFNASRLLWLATFFTTSTISPILSILPWNSCTCSLIAWIFSEDSLTTCMLLFIFSVLLSAVAMTSCVFSRICDIASEILLIDVSMSRLAFSISRMDSVWDWTWSNVFFT